MIPNRKTVVEMTIGLLVLAGTAQAAPTFINTCPFLINSPGDYALSADLVCGRGNGVTITSSNVTLKLEGHRITPGADANNAIFAQGASFTMRLDGIRILGPGLITSGGGHEFRGGVFFQFANNLEVHGITVLGLGTGTGAGIEAATCDFLTITANTFGRIGDGIDLIDVHSSTISGNDASGNGFGMISTFNVSGGAALGTVSNNVFNANTGDGLLVDAFLGATIRDNITVGNGVYGIVLGGGITGPSVVTDNTSLANGNLDLLDTTTNCSGHLWSGDTFFTANQSCIH